jgi:ABC-type sugar transport system permease subunit
VARFGDGLMPYLLVAPLVAVFLLYFLILMLLVVVVSFFNYES